MGLRLHATDVQRVDAAGKIFDPHMHQAIERVESREFPDGFIVDVFQDGYLFHGRVLRPAIVRVAVHPGDESDSNYRRRELKPPGLCQTMSQKRDCYEVLGIERTAAGDEIKSAYRKAALKWHPDRNPQKKQEAEEKFREATEAYSILSDPQKRAAFDRFGYAGFRAAGSRAESIRPSSTSFRISSVIFSASRIFSAAAARETARSAARTFATT